MEDTWYYVGFFKLNILILLRNMKMQMIKRSWVEINLNIIQKNYDIYSKKLHNIVDVMAVIKADGYGHGAVPIAQTLQQNGCNNFAVSIARGWDSRTDIDPWLYSN